MEYSPRVGSMLEFVLPLDEPLELRGRVADVNPAAENPTRFLVGVEFVSVSPLAQGQLDRSSRACEPSSRRHHPDCAHRRTRWSAPLFGPGVLHVARGRRRRAGAQQLGDHVQRHVDAGRDAGGRHHLAVVDEAAIVVHGLSRCVLAQRRDRAVMRGRLEAVEQAGVGQDHRAVAHRQHLLGASPRWA